MRNEKGQFVKGFTYRDPKPYWNKDWLYNQYIILNRSSAEIAAEYNCYDTNILYFLAKFNIPRKPMSEIRQKKYWGSSGDKNPMWNKRGKLSPNWRGGITPERQAFYETREWKKACKQVWIRDNASCQRCGAKIMPGIILHVHHLKSFEYKKLRAEIDNLILLCRICHLWVHSRKNKNHDYIR